MTALNVFYHVPDGRRADFLAAIDREQIRTQVYQEPGCLRYDFYVDANSEDGLLWRVMRRKRTSTSTRNPPTSSAMYSWSRSST